MALCGYLVYPTHELISTYSSSSSNTFTISLKEKRQENDNQPIFLSNFFLKLLIPEKEHFNNGFYAFMMIRIIKNTGEKKNDAVIGYSTNPFFSTYKQNQNSNKKININEWKLTTILGPFPLKKICIQCCDEWLKSTRGIKSKKDKANNLQEYYNHLNVKLYSSDNFNKEEIENFIKHHLPEKYYNEYKNKFM
jgi:hypothetical protein